MTVCLFNGGHCLPFQDEATGNCAWIDDDPAPGLRNNTGALAFAALVAEWLEERVETRRGGT